MPKGYINYGNKAKLYKTTICSIDDLGLTLRSGGWQTKHTKNCINLYFQEKGLPLSIKQTKGQWYVITPKGAKEFNDGMLINLKKVGV